jgi:VIT1/CCC1 family predicted Fe2+/Mn2+ transporter
MVALFGVGVMVSRVTVRTWWYAGLRQMLLGGVAAAATHLFGTLVGSGLG